jgi:hypothetical protein
MSKSLLSAEPVLGDDLVRGARAIGEETGETERQVRWHHEAGHYRGVIFKLPGSKTLIARRSQLRALYSRSACEHKDPTIQLAGEKREEIIAQFTDDVLSKLADAFFQVMQQEGWGMRDLFSISGINETAISDILAGRCKNLTIETIALLTRAMRKRPELILHDLHPKKMQDK